MNRTRRPNTPTLAWISPAFSNRTVLVADTTDGRPLPEGQGPWRLVVASEPRAARWARLITAIDLVPTTAPSP